MKIQISEFTHNNNFLSHVILGSISIIIEHIYNKSVKSMNDKYISKDKLKYNY